MFPQVEKEEEKPSEESILEHHDEGISRKRRRTGYYPKFGTSLLLKMWSLLSQQSPKPSKPPVSDSNAVEAEDVGVVPQETSIDDKQEEKHEEPVIPEAERLPQENPQHLAVPFDVQDEASKTEEEAVSEVPPGGGRSRSSDSRSFDSGEILASQPSDIT